MTGGMGWTAPAEAAVARWSRGVEALMARDDAASAAHVRPLLGQLEGQVRERAEAVAAEAGAGEVDVGHAEAAIRQVNLRVRAAVGRDRSRG